VWAVSAKYCRHESLQRLVCFEPLNPLSCLNMSYVCSLLDFSTKLAQFVGMSTLIFAANDLVFKVSFAGVRF
jgi:hypothetical protein